MTIKTITLSAVAEILESATVLDSKELNSLIAYRLTYNGTQHTMIVTPSETENMLITD